jgi:hypothetical protein
VPERQTSLDRSELADMFLEGEGPGSQTDASRPRAVAIVAHHDPGVAAADDHLGAEVFPPNACQNWEIVHGFPAGKLFRCTSEHQDMPYDEIQRF